MKTAHICSFLLPVLLYTVLVSGQDNTLDMNEDELFSDTSMTVDSSKVVKSGESLGNILSTTTSFSGQVNSYAGLNASRTFFGSAKKSDIKPLASTTGNLMLDIRLPLGIKGFGNVEALWSPDSSKAFFHLQEMFVDVNIKKWLYFRIGKQVLQWGRCSIWNPTDLINIEKKSLLREFGSREGSYGVKAHVPFGTRFNVYGFLDLNNVKSSDSIAGTVKLESLLGNTEIGLALWGKSGYDPICGIDFSTSLLDFSIVGELSITSGNNYSTLDINKINDSGFAFPLPMKKVDDDVVTRLCIGISRFYDLLDVDDRLMIDLEYYFNQAGYKDNLFKKFGGNFNNVSSIPQSTPAVSFEKELSKIYEPNSHSRHYLGISSSISKFIISEMTLSLSGIINLNQKSGTLITNLHYQNMYNFFVGGECVAYLGPNNTEYTFLGNGTTLKIYTGFAF